MPFTRRPTTVCPKCHRTTPATVGKCIYCGAGTMSDPFRGHIPSPVDPARPRGKRPPGKR